MKELTKSEEQIMHILWQINEGFVKDIIGHFPDPKPAYNTVSTIIRILENKKFIDHKAYGRTYQYFPVISKQDYTTKFMKKFMKNYFSGSFRQMLSFFSSEEELSINELEKLKKEMDLIIQKKKQNKL
ncbi:MAG: BlaI/MecI/CopY family transcriptional regulator [Bacteroidales bacterium]|nr:BlaI/MecI/CopY family transcriptional regulator [Bacteroidales bacterium]